MPLLSTATLLCPRARSLAVTGSGTVWAVEEGDGSLKMLNAPQNLVLDIHQPTPSQDDYVALSRSMTHQGPYDVVFALHTDGEVSTYRNWYGSIIPAIGEPSIQLNSIVSVIEACDVAVDEDGDLYIVATDEWAPGFDLSRLWHYDQATDAWTYTLLEFYRTGCGNYSVSYDQSPYADMVYVLDEWFVDAYDPNDLFPSGAMTLEGTTELASTANDIAAGNGKIIATRDSTAQIVNAADGEVEASTDFDFQGGRAVTIYDGGNSNYWLYHSGIETPGGITLQRAALD